MSRRLSRVLETFQKKKASAGTVQQMIVMSNPKTRLEYAPHVTNELLTRISHRINDFENLPPKILSQPSIKRVVKTYEEYFGQIAELDDVQNVHENRELIRILSEFKAEDSKTLPLFALGIKQSQIYPPTLTAQLDDIFTARLSIRMLIDQYCEFGNKIERQILLSEVFEQARKKVEAMTLKQFGVCPKISIEGALDAKMTFVRSFLHHILVELLKNSCRATIETHSGAAGEERRKRLVLDYEGDGMPGVNVVVSGGKEDCVLKVSDEGGGIPRSSLDKIWSYNYTTGQDAFGIEGSNSRFRNNFSGSGYGLPIARVFARYFGGDLSLVTLEGWGTDAYVHLNRVESSAIEQLPD